jgi:hypothetical protein
LCGSVFADVFDATAFQARYVTVMEESKRDMLSAVDYLDGILHDDPQNPEVLIYKGSILAKVASVDFWFWNQQPRPDAPPRPGERVLRYAVLPWWLDSGFNTLGTP